MSTRILIPVLAALCALLATTAAAGPPGSWTRVSDVTGRNIDQVATARTPDGVLHVLWLRKSGNATDLMHTRIGTDGNAIGQPNAVQAGWAAMNNPDVVTMPDGTLRAFWGGIRSTASGDDNDALNTASAGSDGLSWSLQPGHAAQDTSAYASTAGAGAAGSTPVSAWATSFGARVHFGTSSANADVSVQDGIGNCCGYQPDVVTDLASGQTYVGWYSNATNDSGLFVQGVSPGGTTGAKQLVPGSATADRKSSLSIDQRFPIAARVGGGVYVGSGAGYPTYTTVNLWRVGTGAPVLSIPARGAQDVNIAAAPEGRLWLMWHRDNRLWFTRTNKAATRVGRPFSIAGPGGASSTWKVAGDGALGPLDVVASVTNPDGLATWHTQVLPRLELKAAGGKKKARFSVTDAGDPVSGATVKVGGKKLTTGAAGTVSAALKHGRFTATATKSGYAAGGAANVRVKK